MIEEILYEIMKYSPKSVPTLLTLLDNLQSSLLTLPVYEFEDDEIKKITKRLKRYLNLYEKVTSEEGLLKVIHVFCFYPRIIQTSSQRNRS